MTEMASEGVVLTRHYAHYHCSPSRRAFLTGRLPIHHSEALSDADADDIDLRWSTVGHKLESVGYRNYWFGKAHTGYKSFKHLPYNLGFSGGFYGFLGANNDHRSSARWADNRAVILPTERFSTNDYGSRMLSVLDAHDASTPLFMFNAWQETHVPYDCITTPDFDMAAREAAQSCDGREADLSGSRWSPCCMYAMMAIVDGFVGKLNDQLKAKGMWDNALVVVAGDNGGSVAGVSFPLRGEKGTNFEGGIRVATAIGGGLVPKGVRGTTNDIVFSIADWYPTFCVLAGVNPADDPPGAPTLRAGAGRDIYGNSSYPGLDGVDIMPFIAEPHKYQTDSAHPFLAVTGQVLIAGDYKLVASRPHPGVDAERLHAHAILSAGDGEGIGWSRPDGSWAPAAMERCGTFGVHSAGRLFGLNAEGLTPCLFNLKDDAREEHDLAEEQPGRAEELLAELRRRAETAYEPRSPPHLLGKCDTACALQYFLDHSDAGAMEELQSEALAMDQLTREMATDRLSAAGEVAMFFGAANVSEASEHGGRSASSAVERSDLNSSLRRALDGLSVDSELRNSFRRALFPTCGVPGCH